MNYITLLIFFIVSVVSYVIGLYVGSRLDEKESSIRWQHAYNRGWDDAMEAGWQKCKEPDEDEKPPEKEKWELEIVNDTENTPVLSWKSNALHAQKSHRKTEERKWMQ